MKVLLDKEQILESMTKEELIWWIRERAWTSLNRLLWSDVLLFRWDRLSKQNLYAQDRLNEEFKEIGLGKLDDIHAEMRECKSLNRMKELIRQTNAIRAKYANHQKRYNANHAEYQRIQKIYEAIDTARKAEKEACP